MIENNKHYNQISKRSHPVQSIHSRSIHSFPITGDSVIRRLSKFSASIADCCDYCIEDYEDIVLPVSSRHCYPMYLISSKGGVSNASLQH